MSSTQIGENLRKAKKLKPGEDAVMHSRLLGVNSTQDLIKTIQELKQKYDVPVGVKICATYYIFR
jgi:glutamate synthase domain-containing protein 2